MKRQALLASATALFLLVSLSVPAAGAETPLVGPESWQERAIETHQRNNARYNNDLRESSRIAEEKARIRAETRYSLEMQEERMDIYSRHFEENNDFYGDYGSAYRGAFVSSWP